MAVPCPRFPRSWPPPPHDPRERIILCRADDWEVRSFSPGDSKLAYFAPRGFLHLQLWHRTARVSLLTPSRLTAGFYEVFPIEGWKRPVCGYPAMKELVRSSLQLDVPSEGLLLALEAYFVDDVVERLAREEPGRFAAPPRFPESLA